MANHRRYMPLYIGDFLADTLELNAAQTGAYLLLIMHYWQHRGLPDDDRKLAKIARLRQSQFSKMKPHLEHYFQPGWRHKRVEHELQLADEKHEKLSRAGVIGRAKQQAWPGPGRGPGPVIYNKNITTTETVPRESKGSAEEQRAITSSPELDEVIERKGWRT